MATDLTLLGGAEPAGSESIGRLHADALEVAVRHRFDGDELLRPRRR